MTLEKLCFAVYDEDGDGKLVAAFLERKDAYDYIDNHKGTKINLPLEDDFRPVQGLRGVFGASAVKTETLRFQPSNLVPPGFVVMLSGGQVVTVNLATGEIKAAKVEDAK